MSAARKVGPADWLTIVDRDLSVIRVCLAAAPPLVLPALYNCQQAAEIAAAYRYPGETMDLSDDPTAAELASWLAEIESVRADVERFLAP